jgi:hypothetical protein
MVFTSFTGFTPSAGSLSSCAVVVATYMHGSLFCCCVVFCFCLTKFIAMKEIYAIIQSTNNGKHEKELLVDNTLYQTFSEALEQLELIYDTVDMSDDDTYIQISYHIATYNLV